MENSCCSCLTPKATLKCGLCQDSVCKKCAQYLDEESFSFLEKVPADLSHTVYCRGCFEAKVAEPLENYNQAVEKAKNISIYLKDQSKESRLLKRKELPVRVTSCADREELILRLAFLAVQANYNGLVDVDIVGKKIRNGAYQTQEWSGSAIPTHIPDRRR
jgi:hypothetical protein